MLYRPRCSCYVVSLHVMYRRLLHRTGRILTDIYREQKKEEKKEGEEEEYSGVTAAVGQH